MLLMKILDNYRLLVVKFWGSPKLLVNFYLHKGLVPLTLASELFKGQLYVIDYYFLLISLSLPFHIRVFKVAIKMFFSIIY